MSIAAAREATRRAVSVLKQDTACDILTAISGWTAIQQSGAKIHYWETPPATGGDLDYEAGNGYGYTVSFDEDTTIAAKDVLRITASPISRDIGMELQVLRIPARGSAGPVDRVETVKR